MPCPIKRGNMPLVIIILIALTVLVLITHIVFIIIQRRKSNFGKQDGVLIRADNWVQELSLNMVMSYATDLKKAGNGEMPRAWGVDASNQSFDHSSNRYLQVWTELDTTPLQLFGGEPQKVTRETMERVAQQVTDDEINYNNSGKNKLGPVKWMGITTVILALILAAEIVIKIVQAVQS